MNIANSERSIVYDLQCGERTALARIYALFSEQVFGLSYKLLKDTGWSEDIVQEVFYKLWSNKHLLNPNLSLWPYLYTLTKRESLNKLRGIKRSQSAFDRLLLHIHSFSETPEDLVINKELGDKIGKCISQLPKQQELIIIMSKIDGLSHKEIAEKLKISPNTVKNHLIQALKSLKKSELNRDALQLLFLYLLMDK